MSKYSIALRNRQTRINILEYSIENYNKGSRFSDEEEKQFINDYMDEWVLCEFIKLLIEDIFEGWYSKEWDYSDSTDLYKQIVKNCTKSGRKAVIATAKTGFQELLKDRQETEERNMVKTSAIVDYIDG